MKTTEPNQAMQRTSASVTDRAPSSTLRASHSRLWSYTLGKNYDILLLASWTSVWWYFIRMASFPNTDRSFMLIALFRYFKTKVTTDGFPVFVSVAWHCDDSWDGHSLWERWTSLLFTLCWFRVLLASLSFRCDQTKTDMEDCACYFSLHSLV